MSFVVWIVFGLIVGVITAMIVPARTNWAIDIIVGIAGAYIGGFLLSSIGKTNLMEFNLYSIMVSVFGAVVFLSAVRITQKIESHTSYR